MNGLSSKIKAFCLMILTVLLTACHSTGQSFNSYAIDRLQVGSSTFAEAVELLNSEPSHFYYRPDGGYLARWAHVHSLFPDGVYMNRELWLDFNDRGQLIAIRKRHNVHSPGQERLPLESW